MLEESPTQSIAAQVGAKGARRQRAPRWRAEGVVRFGHDGPDRLVGGGAYIARRCAWNLARYTSSGPASADSGPVDGCGCRRWHSPRAIFRRAGVDYQAHVCVTKAGAVVWFKRTAAQHDCHRRICNRLRRTLAAPAARPDRILACALAHSACECELDRLAVAKRPRFTRLFRINPKRNPR